MEYIKLNNIHNYYDKEIVIKGFVDNIRNLQYVIFMIIRDETGKVQVTIEKENNDSLVSLLDNLTIESTVNITGKVLKNEKVKMGGVEVIPSNIDITSKCLEELPFNYKDLNNVLLDTRLDYRFIDLRNEKNAFIFKIESDLVKYLREYCYENNFTEIHTPKLIGAASESGSDVFSVKYFDKTAYLAQSPQFYKQMAMASGLNRIFEVAPCYRAENSNTSRHATEFTSFDIEMSYIDSYDDVMNYEANMLYYALKKINDLYHDKIKELYNVEVLVPNKEFPKIKLNDLYQELVKNYGYKMQDGDEFDLSTEAEKLAGVYAMDKYNSEFIFVTGYPAQKRAFYHMRDENGILLGYDLIWKGVEITSGAQREHRYEIIKKQAEEKGLGKDVAFYLDFFKYGCPPHGGFAIGVDRLIMLLLNIPTIKESQYLFRGPNRVTP